MDIRLIASDLDDSLLNENSQLSPRTLAALDAARAKGCQVAFVSGRMLCAMKPFLQAAHITMPVIAYNGAVLADPDTFTFLEEDPIPREIAVEVLKFTEAQGLHAQVYVNDVCYSAELDETAVRYCNAAHLRLGVDIAAAGGKLSEFLTCGSTKMLIIDDAEKVAALSRDLNKTFGDTLLFASSRPMYLEITRKEANKGNMLRKLSRRLGIPLENMAVFGDGQNDMPMLSIAGYGCCVANAKEEVKAVAPHVCPSNREDGIAQTIERMIADGRIGGRA